MGRYNRIFYVTAVALTTLLAMSLASIITNSLTVNSAPVINESQSKIKVTNINFTFTLYDYAYIVYSKNKTTAYFDIPINYSDGTVNQTVHIVLYGGTTYLVGRGCNVSAKMKVYNGSQGYVVVKVRQVVKNLTPIILKIVNNPRTFINGSIPENLTKHYVKKPAKIVVSKVVPAYEKWVNNILKSKFNLSIKNVSKAFIAVSAAVFIYLSGYIHYNASAMPRTLNETILKHQGDCDDMSRVLINLLWYYGIPAKIVYGYVYLPSLNLTMSLVGSYMRFVNAGPHAFIMVYMPSVGWVSVDFLAGSLLSNPVLIQGTNLKGSVTKKEIKQIRQSLSKIKYAEEVYLYEDHIVPAYLNTTNKTLLLKNLHRLLEPLIALVKKGLEASGVANKTNTTLTITSRKTRTPSNETATTTTIISKPGNTTTTSISKVSSTPIPATPNTTSASPPTTTESVTSSRPVRTINVTRTSTLINESKTLITRTHSLSINETTAYVNSSTTMSKGKVVSTTLSKQINKTVIAPNSSPATISSQRISTSTASISANYSVTHSSNLIKTSTSSLRSNTKITSSLGTKAKHITKIIPSDAVAFLLMLIIMAAVLSTTFLRRK